MLDKRRSRKKKVRNSPVNTRVGEGREEVLQSLEQPVVKTTVDKCEEEVTADRRCDGLAVTPFPILLRFSGKQVEELGMQE